MDYEANEKRKKKAGHSRGVDPRFKLYGFDFGILPQLFDLMGLDQLFVLI